MEINESAISVTKSFTQYIICYYKTQGFWISFALFYPKMTNVLLYVVDSLRADHLSSYGYSRNTTPNLDALADEGVLYENCHSVATWTRPASVSFLTGVYPPAHGVRHREDRFPSELPRLPELLSDEGFETIGISSMGNVSSNLGYDVGFDSYFDLYKDEKILKKRDQSSASNENLLYEDQDKIALPRAEDITEQLTPLYENRTEDLFTFCWSIDPHTPFDPPKEYRSYVDPGYTGPVHGNFASLPDEPTKEDISHLVNLYDGEVRYTDAQLGIIIDKLKQEELYEDTLLIVAGDHGEAFNEHETIFHGNTPYEEVLHVPLIIKPPGEIEDIPQTVTDPVSIIDIYPTILDLLDIDSLPASVQGQAIPPFSEDFESRPTYSDTQLWNFKPTYRTVRSEQWKYLEIQRPGPIKTIRNMIDNRDNLSNPKFILSTIRDTLYNQISNTDTELLFDLEADPGERKNLAGDHPEICKEYRQLLVEWQNECEKINDKIGNTRSTEIDSETKEQLKQLGYA
ncbi:sulfatase-like hydrolase/transferase [Haladaptatus sp. NG-WS-4]